VLLKRVLRRIFWPKRDEAKGEWIYILDKCHRSNQIKDIGMGGACGMHRVEDKYSKSFVK
jgi:hypothetical protein